MEYFALARDRWQDIIVKDSVAALDLRPSLPAEYIATELPSLVDDVYISGKLTSIDGPGKVLGQARCTLVREQSDGTVTPVSGRMEFDKDDLDYLSNEQWKTVILHEIAHVLGFGTLFKDNKLHSGDPTSDLYLGVAANAEWQKLCPGGRIPIETDGTSGTAGAHWDEVCLDGELMTGYLDLGFNPISRLTIAAFEDLGYTVNMDAADAYTVDNLGACDLYCPAGRRRELVNDPPRRELVVRPSAKISEVGLKIIMEEAAKTLKELRSSMPSNLPDGLVYVGGDQITVYIIDIDGAIKHQTVTFEEVQGRI